MQWENSKEVKEISLKKTNKRKFVKKKQSFPKKRFFGKRKFSERSLTVINYWWRSQGMYLLAISRKRSLCKWVPSKEEKFELCSKTSVWIWIFRSKFYCFRWKFCSRTNFWKFRIWLFRWQVIKKIVQNNPFNLDIFDEQGDLRADVTVDSKLLKQIRKRDLHLSVNDAFKTSLIPKIMRKNHLYYGLGHCKAAVPIEETSGMINIPLLRKEDLKKILIRSLRKNESI